MEPRSKADERLERAMTDPECKRAIETLVRLGYKPGTVADVMNTMDMLELPEDVRVVRLGSVGIQIAEGENRIRWYRAYGHVWCVRSTTQCDYCGQYATWKMPQYARPYRDIEREHAISESGDAL